MGTRPEALGFKFRNLIMLAVVLGLSLGSGSAWANSSCLMPLGDVTGDGATDVSDVQCSILMSLAGLESKAPDTVPCLNVDSHYADVDCSGATTVSDVLMTVWSALGELNPQLDTDVSGCPDSCERAVLHGLRDGLVSDQ